MEKFKKIHPVTTAFCFPLCICLVGHIKNNLNTVLGLTSWRMRRNSELPLLTLKIHKLNRSYKEITQNLRSIYGEAFSKKLILRPNSSKKIHFKGFWYLQVHFLRADINDRFLGTCRHWGVFAFKTTFGINENNPRQKGNKKERGKTLKCSFSHFWEKGIVGFNSIKSLELLQDQLNSAFSTSKYFVFSSNFNCCRSWAQKLHHLTFTLSKE